MNKKILIILGIIFGIIVIGLGIFWYFYPGKLEETKETIFGLFLIGGEKTTTQPPGTISITPPIVAPNNQPGQQKTLVQLTQKAVSGATFTKDGFVRYFEKATGNIYDVGLQGENPLRISNTTIPNIFEVHWSPDGDQAVIRYAEKNETAIEDIARIFSFTSITATSSNGIFLPSTIKTIISSPKENKIFYLVLSEDINLGIVASFEDKKQKQVLSTPFGDFLASWPEEKTIALLAKPSATTKGYLYKLDPLKDAFERILSGIPGLTALWSPDGKYIIYSESGYDNLKTNIYSFEEKKMLSFNATTLPEKCVWSKNNKEIIYCAAPSSLPLAKYPDDWYQGLISFSDKMWKINISEGTTQLILDKNEPAIDAINLFLSQNEDYLFFQNKKDGTLWSLRLQ